MARTCVVCTSNTAKYKCPSCYIPFCSVTCGKNHKEGSCQPRKSTPTRPRSNLRPPWGEQQEENLGSTGNDFILTPQQLCALNSHNEVQRKIRDDRLMAILQRIDGSSNRAAALEKEMRNPEFVEFCDDVLEAVDLNESAR